MKKIYTFLLAITFSVSSVNAEEVKCNTLLEKVNPACSKTLKKTGTGLGKMFEGLKKFSDKHQTIGQSLGMEKKEKKSLKQITKENKTINDTINNFKKK
jgi:hypothetical protein